jgi:hypothetical protein
MTTAIIDPTRPALLFDGKARIHSTCRDCGEAMLVTSAIKHTHPNCTEKPTRLETLLTGWISAVMASDYQSAALTDQEIKRLTEQPPDLLSAATLYARWSWPVFPLAAHGKVPAVPKSKGGQGFKDAKTDVARIERWWSKHPDHNIGLATGHLFDVIDIDPRHDGVQSFLNLLTEYKLPDVHAIATTASGGMHLYVKPTGKGNFANLRPGVDYRGRGGYVVTPPSTLGTPGRSYTWLTEPSPIIKEHV